MSFSVSSSLSQLFSSASVQITERSSMAAQKWLIIVVDGDATMETYWPTIVSEYLQKIVRYFCGNSGGQGVNSEVCEVGLIMYNANSGIGCDLQFIDWTREVDQFLNRLPYLAFNGDGLNPSAMAEGLAEALLMFQKSPTGTPTREYFNGERHCILVAAIEPIPRKMTVALPKIRGGELIDTQIEICMADYRRVVQMFTPLAVSLSVISPKQLPVLREIFNLGNNILGIARADPFSSSGTGQFIVLLSDNLKEAQTTLNGQDIVDVSSQRSVEPKETTTNITLPSYSITSGGSEDFFLHGKITKEPIIAQQITEAAKTGLKSATSLESQLVVPQNQNAIDQSQVASSNSFSLMTVYDDIMAELDADNDIVLPRNKPKTCITLEEDNLKELFQPNQLTSPFNDIGNPLGPQQSMSSEKQISMEALLEIQAEFEQALLGTPQNIISKGQTSITASTANASKEVKSLPPVEPKAPSSGIRSTKILLQSRGNSMSVLNHINSSWSNSAASALLPRNFSSSQPTGPQAEYVGVQSTSGIMKTTAILQGINARDTQIPAEVAFGSIAPHTKTNSNIQPSSSSRRQSSSDIGSQLSASISGPLTEQNLSGYKRDLMSAFGPPTPAVRASTSVPSTEMHQRTHTRLLLPSVPMENQRDYVKTWEGAISGILQNSTLSLNEAMAYRKVTASKTLTVQWPQWLQISRTIRQSVVNNSMSISRGPVDYVVFEILRSNNNDLHDCLRNRDFCAKFNLPSQTLILTPTNDPTHFIGTVLQGKQDFPVLRFTHASSSKGKPKQPKVPNKKLKELQ